MKKRKFTLGIIISVCLIFMYTMPSSAEDISLSAAEENLICRFVMAACGEEAPLAAKIGVVNVILNRLADSSFPDTVTEVIFKGEFECVENGSLNEPFSASLAVSAQNALRAALSGHDPSGGAISFARKSSAETDISISFEAGGFVFGK